MGAILAMQLLLTAGLHITTYFCTCECGSSSIEVSLITADNDDDCCETENSSRISIDQYNVISFSTEGFWVKLLSTLFSYQFLGKKYQEHVSVPLLKNIGNDHYLVSFLVTPYSPLLQKCVLNI